MTTLITDDMLAKMNVAIGKHHEPIHVSFKEISAPPKCSYSEMWAKAFEAEQFAPSAEHIIMNSFKPKTSILKVAPGGRVPHIPMGPVFKAFTTFELLAKVREYVKAGWRRGDLGFWQQETGVICLMGGVWRFLNTQLNDGYIMSTMPVNDAIYNNQTLARALTSFCKVIAEQHPGLTHYKPIEHMRLDELSNYVISYNDGVATGPEDICALLEKAMVRELERV